MKFKNITFMNYNNNYGYWVRVSRYGKKRQKYFAINDYVSRMHCLNQAIYWRDRIIKSLEKTELSLEKILKKPTGVQHKPIARVFTKTACSGHTYYGVRYRYGKDAYYKSWNSGIYGHEVAKQKAEANAHAINSKLNLKELNKEWIDNNLQIHLKEMGIL